MTTGKQPGDCGYIALYNGKRLEVYAPTSYAASLKAREHFKVPKSRIGQLSVTLAERPDGTAVIHTADF